MVCWEEKQRNGAEARSEYWIKKEFYFYILEDITTC